MLNVDGDYCFCFIFLGALPFFVRLCFSFLGNEMWIIKYNTCTIQPHHEHPKQEVCFRIKLHLLSLSVLFTCGFIVAIYLGDYRHESVEAMLART
jgi:hypothetical protein